MGGHRRKVSHGLDTLLAGHTVAVLALPSHCSISGSAPAGACCLGVGLPPSCLWAQMSWASQFPSPHLCWVFFVFVSYRFQGAALRSHSDQDSAQVFSLYEQVQTRCSGGGGAP